MTIETLRVVAAVVMFGRMRETFRFVDGRDGFIRLSGRIDPSIANGVHDENLLDHACATVDVIR